MRKHGGCASGKKNRREHYENSMLKDKLMVTLSILVELLIVRSAI